MNTIKGLVKNSKGKHPGYCLNHRTNICEKRKDGVCNKCSEEISEILKMHHSTISLENRCKLNQRQQFEYFFYNELRRKNGYKDYSPKLRNILSSDKNLSKLKYNELELGQIYEVFENFISDMIQKYKTENDLGVMEENSFLKSFYESDSISDFVHYNIIDRKFSFNVIGEKELKNTVFQYYQKNLNDLMKPEDLQDAKISDIKISFKDRKISLNSIPEFYIRTKNYNNLSDQIANIEIEIMNGNHEIEASEENLKAIQKYFKAIKYIEHLCKSSRYMADNYIRDILEKRTNNMKKKGLNDKDIFIATNKNPQRATEKIIKDYNGDLCKLRDLSRASLVFDTQLDLVNWAIEFVEMLNKYNKTELDPQKKVTDISFVSKFGYSRTISKKNSGYRDAKFIIKLGDGNVVEIQFHIKSLFNAKHKGINQIRNLSISEIINHLNFTEKEYCQINEIIDSIDRDICKKPKPKYFDKLKTGDSLSSDQVYSIYRLLNTYDRFCQKKSSRNISEWTLLEKLQYLEKEINHQGYKTMIDSVFGMFSDKQNKLEREKIIKTLKTKIKK